MDGRGAVVVRGGWLRVDSLLDGCLRDGSTVIVNRRRRFPNEIQSFRDEFVRIYLIVMIFYLLHYFYFYCPYLYMMYRPRWVPCDGLSLSKMWHSWLCVI